MEAPSDATKLHFIRGKKLKFLILEMMNKDEFFKTARSFMPHSFSTTIICLDAHSSVASSHYIIQGQSVISWRFSRGWMAYQ
jgi:hypothetical protein